jgi:hypothetical protein
MEATDHTLKPTFMYCSFSTRLILTLALLGIGSIVSAQHAWDSGGNNADSTYRFGTNNDEKLRIMTNDSVRLTINKNGDAVFEKNIIDTAGWLRVDSIRARVIHVGDSSVTIGTNTFSGNVITTNNGILGMGRDPGTFATFQLGVGVDIPAGVAKFQLNADGTGNSFALFTNGYSGSGGSAPTNGVRIGLDGATNIAEFRQQLNSPINFYTVNTYRMMINGVNALGATQFSAMNNAGFVGINETRPLSQLHVGTFSTPAGAIAGWRSWMRTGTFYGEGNDNMYVGLRQNEDNGSGDRKDAIIEWGDNVAGNATEGPDVLRFIFASNFDGGATTSGSQNGLEVARMMPNGNVGVGNFSSTGGANAPPVNRLDVRGNQCIGVNYAAFTTAQPNGLLVQGNTQIGFGPGFPAGSNAQLEIFNTATNQLRLIQNNAGIGVGSNFRTTALGDLEIFTHAGLTLRRVGINTTLPTSTVDINGDLNIRTVINDNSLTRVLVIDPLLNNKVRWADATLFGIQAAQNAAWINTSNNSVEWGTMTLLHNTEIPMIDGSGNEYNIYFSGQSHLQNERANVGIGYPMSSPLLSKLDVLNTTQTIGASNFVNQFAGRFVSDGTYNVSNGNENIFGVYGESTVEYLDETHSWNIGGYFTASNGAEVNVGAYGEVLTANVSGTNFGLYGIADNDDGSATGVYAEGMGLVQNVGVSGSAYGGSIFNYGVVGSAPLSTSSPVNYAGYFIGDMFFNGSYQASDMMLKQNVQELSTENAIDIIEQLSPKTYNFDTTGYPSMSLPGGLQYGLIAQEVETVLPTLIKPAIQPAIYDSDGNVSIPSVEFKAMNYTELIPILVAAVKELNQSNKDLAGQLQALQDCCNASGEPAPMTPQGDNGGNPMKLVHPNHVVELNNYAIVLDQNSPNPFAEQTTITYKIPVDVKDAQLFFYDNNGRVLKVVQITERGEGSLLVYASNLSSGTYTYSLVADAKLIDTKKMHCQK